MKHGADVLFSWHHYKVTLPTPANVQFGPQILARTLIKTQGNGSKNTKCCTKKMACLLHFDVLAILAMNQQCPWSDVQCEHCHIRDKYHQSSKISLLQIRKSIITQRNNAKYASNYSTLKWLETFPLISANSSSFDAKCHSMCITNSQCQVRISQVGPDLSNNSLRNCCCQYNKLWHMDQWHTSSSRYMPCCFP